MNKTHVWVEIVCWKCSIVGFGRWVTGSKIPIREFKLEAKEAGWRQTTGGEFECKHCTMLMFKEMGINT